MNRLLKLMVVLCLMGISTTTFATGAGKKWTAVLRKMAESVSFRFSSFSQRATTFWNN